MARFENGDYKYEIGQDIGLTNLVNTNEVEWYKLLFMESDDELPIGWFYLVSEEDKLNIHESPYGMYAQIVESISGRIVTRD